MEPVPFHSGYKCWRSDDQEQVCCPWLIKALILINNFVFLLCSYFYICQQCTCSYTLDVHVVTYSMYMYMYLHIQYTSSYIFNVHEGYIFNIHVGYILNVHAVYISSVLVGNIFNVHVVYIFNVH